MLPIEMAARLKNPGLIEKQFLQYLKDSGAKVTQSKTIASQILYHQKDLTGLNSTEFFTGEKVNGMSNINGSFVRPESEHFVIYGIRCLYAEEASPLPDTIYNNGILSNLVLSGPVPVNSVFSMTVNSIRVLKNVPLTEFDSLSTDETGGFFLLNEPVLWMGQTELKIALNAKPGQTYAGENIRFELLGIGLI